MHAVDFEVLGRQIFGEHLTQFAVVVDQQHSRFAPVIRSVGGGYGQRSYAHTLAQSGVSIAPARNFTILNRTLPVCDTCLHSRSLGWSRQYSFTGLELNMKSNRNLLTATLLVAGALVASAAGVSVASAADDTTTTTAPPPAEHGPHGWHHHGGPMHLLSKLNLSADQKAQVKSIMTAARPQMESLHQQMHANMLKLQQTAPTDPNYTAIARR